MVGEATTFPSGSFLQIETHHNNNRNSKENDIANVIYNGLVGSIKREVGQKRIANKSSRDNIIKS